SLNWLRNRASIPIVILIDGGNDIDRIVGLEFGADDCLSKPFNQREFLARVHAVLRRFDQSKGYGTDLPGMYNGNPSVNSKKLQVGDVEMDLGSRSITCLGGKVDLTTVEFNLLECFLKNPGELQRRETLNEQVLGRPLTPYDRSIDVHVSKLRKKLGFEMSEHERIKAIRGEGYLYAVYSGIVSTDENLGS
ncbi:MAG: response regulator transcription factor, partial [Rubrobacteridae bacterium]|nr:response regulator transcription factor [Rubrobacteridae bacterium]